MADRFQNLIDGTLVDPAAGGSFEDLNPANRSDVLGVFPRSDYRDVDRAVEVARGYRLAWRDFPGPQRASVLFRAAELLAGRLEEFAQMVVREMGKVLREARAEVQGAVETLAGLAGDVAQPPLPGSPRDAGEGLGFGLRGPLGVAGVIGSWAHPLGGVVRQVTPALAAGCPVVLKPAEDTPLVAMRLVELLLEAGLPPAALSLIQGTGEEAGAPLVRHPDVAVVSFAGSPGVGREVAIACAAEQRSLLLDVGGRSATIVLEDAEIEPALEGALAGALAASGQGRAPASRLLVHRRPCRDFTERLAARLQALRVGDGLAPETELGPLINETRLKRTHAFGRQGQKEGARLVCGGEALREGEQRKGCFYAPTLLAEATPGMRIAREAAHGPVLVLLQVGSLDEALEAVERTGVRAGLAIYTRRLDLACRAIDRTAVGAVSINAPVGSAGGRRGTPGRPGVEAFSVWRSVVMSPGRGWRRGADRPAGRGEAAGEP